MVLTKAEYEVIITTSKIIPGDIRWSIDSDHPSWVEFRVDEVATKEGFPIFVVGSYNYEIPALRICLIHKGAGRIHGLCFGTGHHNPGCENVGEKHKHRWTEPLRDKEAYTPSDISAELTDIPLVWRQFCLETNIIHEGNFPEPPPKQEELL